MDLLLVETVQLLDEGISDRISNHRVFYILVGEFRVGGTHPVVSWQVG